MKTDERNIGVAVEHAPDRLEAFLARGVPDVEVDLNVSEFKWNDVSMMLDKNSVCPLVYFQAICKEICTKVDAKDSFTFVQISEITRCVMVTFHQDCQRVSLVGIQDLIEMMKITISSQILYQH
jgi:hypothetical protein